MQFEQTNAMRHARVGAASTMGINRTSGGMGKNELSANENAASIHRALGCSAFSSVQLYRLLNINPSSYGYGCMVTVFSGKKKLFIGNLVNIKLAYNK